MTGFLNLIATPFWVLGEMLGRFLDWADTKLPEWPE
jgi:hypothetical protein